MISIIIIIIVIENYHRNWWGQQRGKNTGHSVTQKCAINKLLLAAIIHSSRIIFPQNCDNVRKKKARPKLGETRVGFEESSLGRISSLSWKIIFPPRSLAHRKHSLTHLANDKVRRWFFSPKSARLFLREKKWQRERARAESEVVSLPADSDKSWTCVRTHAFSRLTGFAHKHMIGGDWCYNKSDDHEFSRSERTNELERNMAC